MTIRVVAVGNDGLAVTEDHCLVRLSDDKQEQGRAWESRIGISVNTDPVERPRPLRYYFNRLSRGVVRSVYRKMVREGRAMRSTIELIDLENWQPLSLEEEE